MVFVPVRLEQLIRFNKRTPAGSAEAAAIERFETAQAQFIPAVQGFAQAAAELGVGQSLGVALRLGDSRTTVMMGQSKGAAPVSDLRPPPVVGSARPEVDPDWV
jgi:hypothetical protein